MKSTIFALALTAGLAVSTPGYATVTYSFIAPFAAGFDLAVASDITSDSTFDAASLNDCWSIAGPCESVTFYMNAQAAGLGPHSDWEAVSVTSVNSATYDYYFFAPAFSTTGLNASVDGAQYASLNVSAVPEPSSIALLTAGIPLGWVALRRRRANRV